MTHRHGLLSTHGTSHARSVPKHQSSEQVRETHPQRLQDHLGCSVHRGPQAAYALCPSLLLSRNDPKETPGDTQQFVHGAIHCGGVYRKGRIS